MNILYLNRQTEWDCNELRYSLRSLAEYGKNIEKVFVCGFCPSWLSKEVVKIPCGNPYDRKAKNVTHRVLYALKWLKNHRYEGDLLLSSDDIFHTDFFDADKYPYFWKNGAVVSLPDEYKGTKIYSIIEGARTFLQQNGLSLNDYGGGHILHHIDMQLVEDNRKLFLAAQDTKYGVPFDLIMGALINEYRKPQWIEREDIKCEKDNEISEALINPDVKAFSIDDSALTDVSKEVFAYYYDKCKYEI